MLQGVVYEGTAIVITPAGEAWFATAYEGGVVFGAAWHLIVSENCSIVYLEPTRSDGSDTASYEPDQADIDAMTLDCGEDNWAYVFDDDELTGYYCLDDTASYEPDQADIDAMTLDCGEDNWGYVFDDDELTGYYCLDDTATRYPVGDPTGDCDENGVEDGSEFNPPPCFIAPDFDDDTNPDPTAIDVDDDDRDFMNEQCPSGWLVYETTTEDGDTVVQGECIEEDDPVTPQSRDDDDLMDTLLWTVCPNGWSTGNDGSFECEDNVIDDSDASNSGIGDGDCNENGIRDGDELLPPDCLVSPDSDGDSDDDNSDDSSSS